MASETSKIPVAAGPKAKEDFLESFEVLERIGRSIWTQPGEVELGNDSIGEWLTIDRSRIFWYNQKGSTQSDRAGTGTKRDILFWDVTTRKRSIDSRDQSAGEATSPKYRQV